MSDRIRHFRAGLLLVLSSTVILWPISYWFPLPDYLVAIGDEEYSGYKQTLELIVDVYLMFLILNLVNAGFCATKINYRVKLWLSLIAAFILFLFPVLLVIPVAIKFPKQTFFEIFQGLYGLLRFNSLELFWWAIISTAISVALNIGAAIILKTSPQPEQAPKHLRHRYLFYSALMALVFALMVVVGLSNASVRAEDRKVCQEYSDLALPKYDSQVDAYISNIRAISDKAGSTNLKKQFVDFTELSREYVSLVITEPDNATKINQYGEAIANVKGAIDFTCAEFSVK